MTLQQYTDSLPKKKQIELALRLVRLALPIWEKYSNENDLSYRDSVVGMNHRVDQKLLQDCTNRVEEYLQFSMFKKIMSGKTRLQALRKQFDDPIIALQDADWELPDEVLKTFYSVYNLIDTVVGEEKTTFADSTISVSINQAADAIETSKSLTSDQINAILNEFSNGR
jgi:hypothetical protein